MCDLLVVWLLDLADEFRCILLAVAIALAAI